MSNNDPFHNNNGWNNNNGFAGESPYQAPVNRPVANNNYNNNNPSSIFDSDELFGGLKGNAVAGMGIQLTKSMVDKGMAQYMPGASLLWGSLHYYFNVNNSYVLNKLKIILAPFLHKNWKRVIKEAPPQYNPDGTYSSVILPPSPAPPVGDVNSPDFYLPTMSFVTFVLVVGLLEGANNKFSPEILLEVSVESMLWLAVEVIALKVGFYLLEIDTNLVATLDLMAYTGYKFVPLCINMVIGLCFGKLVYYICVLYTGACLSWFFLQTLKQIVSLSSDTTHGKKRKQWFIFGISAMQLFLVWWLGYSGIPYYYCLF